MQRGQGARRARSWHEYREGVRSDLIRLYFDRYQFLTYSDHDKKNHGRILVRVQSESVGQFGGI